MVLQINFYIQNIDIAIALFIMILYTLTKYYMYKHLH